VKNSNLVVAASLIAAAANAQMSANVADKNMLANKTDDKVRFRVESLEGAPTMSRIKPSR
jgi:hypothetical protein